MIGKDAAGIKPSLLYSIFTVCNIVFLIALALLCVIPIINILAISFSTPAIASGGKVTLWPINDNMKLFFNMDAYNAIIHNRFFWSSLWISLERVTLGTALNLAMTILTSYVLSRDSDYFKARKYYIWFFFFPSLFSGGLIPTYLIIRFTGLYDTIWSLIIPGSAGIWNCVLMLNFFRQLPKEMEEAAIVDGSNHPGLLFRIILPVSKPVIATVALFVMVGHWNSWFDGMIYMSSISKAPLQTYLRSLLTIDLSMINDFRTAELAARQMSTKTLRAAMVFVTALPIMCVYPFLQKYFAKGLVLGSVKG